MTNPSPKSVLKRYPAGSIFQGLMGCIFQGILRLCQEYTKGIVMSAKRVTKERAHDFVQGIVSSLFLEVTGLIVSKIIKTGYVLFVLPIINLLIRLVKDAISVLRSTLRSKIDYSNFELGKGIVRMGITKRSTGATLKNTGLYLLIEYIREELTVAMVLPQTNGS